MNTERVALIGVTLLLVVGGVAMVLAPTVVTGPGQAPAQAGSTTTTTADGGLGALFGLTLWGVTVLFGGTALVWLVLTYVIGSGYEAPPVAYGPEDVQVRIMTVDAEDIVQQTVDSVPDGLTDIHVIAEASIDVTGATVHVVPEAFESRAVRKGRAQEWARQALSTDREFVLYLDEDSLLEEFDGLPDADVVQLQERPRRTGSVLSYLADVYRMGVQIEQRAFARLSIPLFAWGGGIAVRAEVEDAVTWDRETLVEDTAFVWAAFREHEIDFALSTAVCRNEAPPSLYELFEQRRRWSAGNLQTARILPLRYELLTRLRNYTWGLSPIVLVVVIPLSALGASVGHSAAFLAASVGLALFTAFWFVRGVAYYGKGHRYLVLALPLSPLVTVIHAAGTVGGILGPPDRFRVTTKVGAE